MKLFVDIDGVLTNFNLAVAKIGGEAGLKEDASEKEKLDMYRCIDKAGETFWSDMEWKEDGKSLWDSIRVFNPVLLTSPGQFLYAKSGKMIWIDRNIPGTTVLFETEKSKYAERDAILIDDMPNNIAAWEGAGGFGILHKTTIETERAFLRLLWREPLLKPDMNQIQNW